MSETYISKTEDGEWAASTSGTQINVKIIPQKQVESVGQPVCRGGNRHGLGTEFQRKHFACHDPRYRTPGCRKEGNEDADENNEYFLPCKVFDGDCFTNDSDDIFAKTHAHATNNQETASTKAFDTIYPRESHYDVDDVGDNRYDERILNTRVFKECDAIVEHEVDCQSPILVSI